MVLKGASAPDSPPKRQRYWSVMLVGEHGRIIPFRHFKAVAITIAITLILSLAGLALQSVRYAQQGRSIQSLLNELDEVKAQAASLRNEKDLLLTRMVIDSVQPVGSDSNPEQASETTPGQAPAAAKKDVRLPSSSPASAAEPAAPKTPAPPRVRWQADIRQFEVNYQQGQERLQATFRIYNTSTPKQALSGTIVMVFRNKGDASVQWLPVPEVPLQDGKPSARGGQSFRINNYRTMTFNAERLKLPLVYDTATVFVFEREGALLLERDFPLDIAFQEPAERADPSGPTPVSEPSNDTASTVADVPAQAPDEDAAASAKVAGPDSEATAADDANMENEAGAPATSEIDRPQGRSGQEISEHESMDTSEPAPEKVESTSRGERQ